MADRRATLLLAIASFVIVGLLAVGAGYMLARHSAPVSTASSPPSSTAIMTPPTTGTPSADPSNVRQAAFDATVFEPISPRAQTSRVPVIMYHDIVKRRGPGSVWFDCTKAEFEAQMAWLSEQGAQPITLEQLHRHLTRGEAIPANAIVLTFDDNYQGFHDNAFPILKQYGFPSAMFVHTNFVGDKKGPHPKMDWDTLRALDQSGLVTIGSHTLSHPDDMALLPVEKQDEEMVQAKAILEEQLGHPVPYFAYPNGKGDAVTFDAARRAGYTMAFTIVNGPAEESPSILTVNRTIHTRLEQAWKQAQDAVLAAPAVIVEQQIKDAPVTLEVAEYDGVKLGLVRGGLPTTRHGVTRQSVGEFVRDANGVAGINGTFFGDAALRGTDNTMIGPCLTAETGIYEPDRNAYRLTRLVNRPLVAWGGGRIAIVPFQPGQMNEDPSALQALVPGVTDAFLAGAWIVHGGVARTQEEIAPFAARDFNDPRRRAFLGLTVDGEVVLGGTLDVVTTTQMASAAAAAGVAEAVLLDSGFSTSVVFDGKIVVTGHTAKNLPSRPVPHAIVLSGTLQPPVDPATIAHLDKAEPAVGKMAAADAQAQAPGPSRRRRRR